VQIGVCHLHIGDTSKPAELWSQLNLNTPLSEAGLRYCPCLQASEGQFANELLVDRLPVTGLDMSHAPACAIQLRELAQQHHTIEHLQVGVHFVQNNGHDVVTIVHKAQIAPLHFRAKMRRSGKDGSVHRLSSIALLGPKAVIKRVNQRGGL
jgi:hypothetical protein